MSTFYFDFNSTTNGIGSPGSPFNLDGWRGTVVSGGNSYLFKRGTVLEQSFETIADASYGAWFNPDGSDDPAQPRPIVRSTSPFSTYSSANKDGVEISNWDILAKLPLKHDSYVIFCGKGTRITGCHITSNVGCIANFGKSGVEIDGNVLNGVSEGKDFSNCVLLAQCETAFGISPLTIRNNRIYHAGSGNTNAHAVRIESLAPSLVQHLTFEGNEVGPALQPDAAALHGESAEPGCKNEFALGVRLTGCIDARIHGNTVTGMLEGISFHGGGIPMGCAITGNNCSHNRHYGIHVSSFATGCMIEYNACSHNGTQTNNEDTHGPLRAYGRGIELSSAGGQDMCKGHTIRFNTCEFNKNYGGPHDNASEGVGIGLDDGTCGCTVYGNVLRFNEGNGIQIYGNIPKATDTSNKVVANFFYENCTAAFRDRRNGGTAPTLFVAHLGCTYAKGGTTLLANNVFAGKTPVGIYVDGNSENVLLTNNLFMDVPHCVMLPDAGLPANTSITHNNFYSRDLEEQLYCTDRCGADMAPLYAPPPVAPLTSSDLTFGSLVAPTYPF